MSYQSRNPGGCPAIPAGDHKGPPSPTSSALAPTLGILERYQLGQDSVRVNCSKTKTWLKWRTLTCHSER